MKSFLCKMYCFMQSVGYARAASELARNGKYTEAQKLIQQKGECTC